MVHLLSQENHIPVGAINPMTIAELQTVFDDISYPGVKITVRRRSKITSTFAMVKVDIHIAAIDSRDPDYEVTLRRTFEVMPMRMSAKDAINVAFQEIVRHLAHEAAEHFRYRGELPFNPHVYGEPEAALASARNNGIR